MRDGLIAFVDVEQLFSHSRRVEDGGTLGPSNNARLRTYLRRTHSQGAGIAQDFLDTLRGALAHYDIDTLEYSEHLERALLRMFASQRDPSHRHRLVMSMLRRVIALVNSGVSLAGDTELRDALVRIAAMRGEISNAVADTALEAHYRAYQGVEMVRHAESTTRDLERWLAVAESAGQTPSPPAEVLEGLAIAPAAVFARVEEWLRSADRWKRVIALSAYVRRLYAPKKPQAHRSELIDGRWVDRSRHDGKLVLAAVCTPEELSATLRSLSGSANTADTLALELIVAAPAQARAAALSAGDWLARAREGLSGALLAQRVTVSVLVPGEPGTHHTFAAGENGLETLELHGLHPETATRIDLVRYGNFELERLWAPRTCTASTPARARIRKTSACSCSATCARAPRRKATDAELFTPIFERAFQEAARTLRLNLGIRDPRRAAAVEPAGDAHGAPGRCSTPSPRSAWRAAAVEHPLPRRRKDHRAPQAAERRATAAIRPREIEVVGSDLARVGSSCTWRRPRAPAAGARIAVRAQSRRRAPARTGLSVRDRAHADER